MLKAYNLLGILGLGLSLAACGESPEAREASAAEMAEAIPADSAAAQPSGPKLGDRRLVVINEFSATSSKGRRAVRCEVYQMTDIDMQGNKAAKWSRPWLLVEENLRECQNATNRSEFFAANPDLDGE